MVADLVSLEGELFPQRPGGRPALFQIIDCPQCGEREQPLRHDNMPGAHHDSDNSS
jgi:hypothetical protein